MKLNPSIAGWATALLGAAALLVTTACGGSQESGGVGSGGSGLTVGNSLGTVNGFGSVFIDGVRYDDSRIPAMREIEPGIEVTSEVRLGDSVEAEYAEGNALTRLHVSATVSGRVTGLGMAGAFMVLGQPVVLNTNSWLGPVTQFGGFDATAAVAVGDAVDVHGLIVRQSGSYVIQATRIQRLTALPKYLKVTGLVSALGTGSFKLGDLSVDSSSAVFGSMSDTALAQDKVVSVLALATSQSGTDAAPQVKASQIRIKKPGASGDDVLMSGSLSDLDVSAQQFCLDGYLIRYTGVQLSPGYSSLSNGGYVRVRGRVLADGTIQATEITVRNGVNEPDAELRGNITGYQAAVQSFQVRGVTVDVSQAMVTGCSARTLGDGTYVIVTGALNSTGVTAARVTCGDEPTNATVARQGTVGSVDLAATCFILTMADGRTLTVQWDGHTFFRDLGPSSLNGHTVNVEGEMVNGELVAQKIVVNDW